MGNDETKNETMTIREMCDMFDVTARTLRFYESKELLSPQREGQKRLYANRERARLKLILRGKRFGLDLEKIRQILDLYELGDAGHIQLAHSLEIGKVRIVEMIEQRDELTLGIEDLTKMVKWAEEKIQSAQTETAKT